MSTRRINLESCHLIALDNGSFELRGNTEKGGHYAIAFSVDASGAQCGIVKLSRVVAKQIAAERGFHRFLRDQVAEAWRNVNAVVEEKQP